MKKDGESGAGRAEAGGAHCTFWFHFFTPPLRRVEMRGEEEMGVVERNEMKQCRKFRILLRAGMLDRPQSNVHTANQQYWPFCFSSNTAVPRGGGRELPQLHPTTISPSIFSILYNKVQRHWRLKLKQTWDARTSSRRPAEELGDVEIHRLDEILGGACDSAHESKRASGAWRNATMQKQSLHEMICGKTAGWPGLQV